MKYFSLEANETTKYVQFPFIKNNEPMNSEVMCGLTLLAGGNMRFRWNETNAVRDGLLKEICGFGNRGTDLPESLRPVPLELIHSHIVYDLKTEKDTLNKQADGMITKNPELLPVVTVADCVPIYLYDAVTGVFGIVHSGWKGTGIIQTAIELAKKNYGSKSEDFSVVIGPHIKDCCYIVNEERADYFAKEFTPDCVTELEEGGSCYCNGRGLSIEWNNGTGKLYRLSLEKANLAALKKAGVPEENIGICKNCTCCTDLCGSNRRQTSLNVKENNLDVTNMTIEEKSKLFTVMAAFVKAK